VIDIRSSFALFKSGHNSCYVAEFTFFLEALFSVLFVVHFPLRFGRKITSSNRFLSALDCTRIQPEVRKDRVTYLDGATKSVLVAGHIVSVGFVIFRVDSVLAFIFLQSLLFAQKSRPSSEGIKPYSLLRYF